MPPVLLLLLIVAAALIVYTPAMRSGFIWDDDRFLTDNPLIKAPDGLRLFWFSTRPLDYFPLTSTTLWIEWRLWHMNAAGYHIVNVLLHAASAVLLWRVLARLRVPGAWLAGLIFAVHPVCAESVAWITERKSTLPLPLFLASLLVYLRFDEKVEEAEPSPISPSLPTVVPQSGTKEGPNLPIFLYLLSLILFLFALLAKTSVVMLPLVLLMCAWWRRGTISRRDLLRAGPFFLLALALSLVTMWYQHYRAIAGDVIRTDDLFGRTAMAGWAVWFYLYKAVLPAGLCFVYPRFAVARGHAPFLPAALLVTVLLLLWRARRTTSARACLLALGYFLAALLPVLGFIDIYFMKYSLVSDHWQYVALIGPIALAAAALCAPLSAARPWAAGRQRDNISLNSRTDALRIAAAAAIVLLFGALTCRQNSIYRDSEALWRDTVRKNPDAWIAWNNLSQILIEKGEKLALLGGGDPEKSYNEALRCSDRAVALHPHAEAWNNRANALIHLGRFREAIQDCDRALAADRDLAGAWNNRGNAYARLGEYGRAIDDLTQTIRLRPDLAAAYFNRGNVRLEAGRLAEAVEDYRQALRLQPDFPAASAALRRMGEKR